jgi:hypothetical protein
MSSEAELNRAILKATVAERIAEEKMIASEKVVVETTVAANKIKEKYAKAVKESTDKVAEKIGREMKRAEVSKVAAEVEAKRVIAEDIKKANATKRAADRALKDYKESRS